MKNLVFLLVLLPSLFSIEVTGEELKNMKSAEEAANIRASKELLA